MKLLENICDLLPKAAGIVLRNNGSPGIDQVTCAGYKRDLIRNLCGLRKRILADNYNSQPARRTFIPKGGGKLRPLDVPTVEDRIVQTALMVVLEREFEPGFNSRSYGFRRGRNQHQAVRQVQMYVRGGSTLAVDADITNFFGAVVHDLLLQFVRARIHNNRIISLVRDILEAGYVFNGVYHPGTRGIPQGSPVSPILANIYLSPMDEFLSHRAFSMVRYADDFVIMARRKKIAVRAKALTSRFLETHLSLELNEEKTALVDVRKEPLHFLGFLIRGAKLYPDPETVRDFIAELHRVPRSGSLNPAADIECKVRGFKEYFRISECTGTFRNIDKVAQNIIMGLARQRTSLQRTYRITPRCTCRSEAGTIQGSAAGSAPLQSSCSTVKHN